MSHTPTPWYLFECGIDLFPGIEAEEQTIVLWSNGDDDGGVRGNAPEEARANAEFIVRACNSHVDLVAALERLIDPKMSGGKWDNALAVLKKAKGEPTA